jgi:hypothetical protein
MDHSLMQLRTLWFVEMRGNPAKDRMLWRALAMRYQILSLHAARGTCDMICVLRLLISICTK